MLRDIAINRGVRSDSRPAVSAGRKFLSRQHLQVFAQAGKGSTTTTTKESITDKIGLGDALGPIGLSYSSSAKERKSESLTDKVGLGDALGPIGLSYSSSAKERSDGDASTSGRDGESQEKPPSIHSMTTAEWRALYEKDGTVDLWLEEEFNAGSRLVGGRVVHLGGTYGIGTGEGPSQGNVPVHKVKIHDHYSNSIIDVEVPQDRYILWEAEDQGLQLPYACRMGCCTACAVRVKSGNMEQVEALGISAELKEQGYGLMCVAYPTTDLELETVPEDEIYELQFGRYFAQQALDPTAETIERDDFALSIANMDE